MRGPSSKTWRSLGRAATLTAAAWIALPPGSSTARVDTIALRGHVQRLHLYGDRTGDPVIVSSGDGGWIHLGPQVAEYLASRGFFVVGFDVRGYLESFTSGATTMRTDDEPEDYRALARWTIATTGRKPILIGVSEGAGLSLLAATDPEMKRLTRGVIGLGLPDQNELGWRWRDATIYITHRRPDEPSFSAAAFAARLAPLPLAAIHSTRDEFVPLSEVTRIVEAAREPKRLWIIDAADHRFSDKVAELDDRLLEAISWIDANSPR
ncbi:MAG TPA: alpha/beta hydrolase [Vicinamibacterales bacterium]|nr:alpha/beta hydrolase [Vicinamibacterales bacterium]